MARWQLIFGWKRSSRPPHRSRDPMTQYDCHNDPQLFPNDHDYQMLKWLWKWLVHFAVSMAHRNLIFGRKCSSWPPPRCYDWMTYYDPHNDPNVLPNDHNHTSFRSVSLQVWLVGSWFLAKNDRVDHLGEVMIQWPTVTLKMTHISDQNDQASERSSHQVRHW